MLAKLARAVPVGPYLYEPKWDGFRCMAFVASDDVDLRSRNQRPLARYFPEVVGDLRRVGSCVLDGELVAKRGGAPEFSSLLARLHPARRRVEQLSKETPATFVVFDALEINGSDISALPFADRRHRL